MVLDLRFCVHPHSRSGVCSGGGGILASDILKKPQNTSSGCYSTA